MEVQGKGSQKNGTKAEKDKTERVIDRTRQKNKEETYQSGIKLAALRFQTGWWGTGADIINYRPPFG